MLSYQTVKNALESGFSVQRIETITLESDEYLRRYEYEFEVENNAGLGIFFSIDVQNAGGDAGGIWEFQAAIPEGLIAINGDRYSLGYELEAPDGDIVTIDELFQEFGLNLSTYESELRNELTLQRCKMFSDDRAWELHSADELNENSERLRIESPFTSITLHKATGVLVAEVRHVDHSLFLKISSEQADSIMDIAYLEEDKISGRVFAALEILNGEEPKREAEPNAERTSDEFLLI